MNIDNATKHHILRERLQAAARIRKHELEQVQSSEATIWKDYGSQTTDYTQTFPTFLQSAGVNNFADFLSQLKQQHHWRKLHVLDIAALIASFIGQHPAIDSGIAITLADTRTQQQKQIDNSKQHLLVEGNIFQRRTWRTLEQRMQQNNITLFDFIIARPYAGMVDRVDEIINAQFCLSILQRLYRLLSNHHGVLIREVPYTPQQDTTVPAYVHFWSANHITATYQKPDSSRHYGYRYALMLTRTELSPARLPIPT